VSHSSGLCLCYTARDTLFSACLGCVIGLPLTLFARANSELLKYYASVSSNRWLMMKASFSCSF
jgi:hypothetical protein